MEPAKGKRVTVMVADDNDDVRRLFGLQLRALGYLVVEAANGQEALELARQSPPSLILMNIHMPVLDGLAATRAIRDSEELRNTAIVAYSSYPSGLTRERALTAGCNEYVPRRECVDQLPSIVRLFADRS